MVKEVLVEVDPDSEVDLFYRMETLGRTTSQEAISAIRAKSQG